jgi:hypothetical protein
MQQGPTIGDRTFCVPGTRALRKMTDIFDPVVEDLIACWPFRRVGAVSERDSTSRNRFVSKTSDIVAASEWFLSDARSKRHALISRKTR